ncbi:MAG: biopolymer transporter ExbD [Verrucomicrobiota bacterium]
MKRFSKSNHHAMSELNITPLLDLAFVLLVIFVITTTPLIEDVNLALPKAASHPKDPPKKPNFISVDRAGQLFLNMKPMDLPGLYNEIVAMRTKDRDLSVIIRGDSAIPYQHVVNVLEVLQTANVIKVSLATIPAK